MSAYHVIFPLVLLLKLPTSKISSIHLRSVLPRRADKTEKLLIQTWQIPDLPLRDWDWLQTLEVLTQNITSQLHGISLGPDRLLHFDIVLNREKQIRHFTMRVVDYRSMMILSTYAILRVDRTMKIKRVCWCALMLPSETHSRLHRCEDKWNESMISLWLPKKLLLSAPFERMWQGLEIIVWKLQRLKAGRRFLKYFHYICS